MRTPYMRTPCMRILICGFAYTNQVCKNQVWEFQLVLQCFTYAHTCSHAGEFNGSFTSCFGVVNLIVNGTCFYVRNLSFCIQVWSKTMYVFVKMHFRVPCSKRRNNIAIFAWYGNERSLFLKLEMVLERLWLEPFSYADPNMRIRICEFVYAGPNMRTAVCCKQ
jgi:hypothetical protein